MKADEIMRFLPHKNVTKTLTFKLILGSQLIIIPLIFFLIFDNLYSINVLHKKVSESKKDTIALYMNEIDSELKSADDYLVKTLSYDMSISNLENDDPGTREIAKVNLKEDIVRAIGTYKLVDGIFVYSSTTKDYLYSYSSRTSYEERIAVAEYTSDRMNSGGGLSGLKWFSSSVDSSNYMFRILNIGSVFVGAWINLDTFIQYINDLDLNQKESFIMASSEGVPLNCQPSFLGCSRQNQVTRAFG